MTGLSMATNIYVIYFFSSKRVKRCILLFHHCVLYKNLGSDYEARNNFDTQKSLKPLSPNQAIPTTWILNIFYPFLSVNLDMLGL